MQQRTLGKTGLPVSALTLGGGGIGMVWGPTTDEECLATVKAAVTSGITMLDLAPVYGKGKSEEIVGQAWRDLPTKPLIATKVFIMPDERKDLAGAIQRSLEGSLKRLGLSHVDVLQLHNQIEPHEPLAPRRLTLHEVMGVGGVLAAMQRLKDAGVVKAIGCTGIARHDVVRDVLADGRVDTVQLVTNLLCSEGEMGARGDGPYRDHLEMLRLAQAAGLGVFGIRPYAAGSLTAAIDRTLPPEHPVVRDFALAQQHLGFLTTETAESLSVIAMRYALSLPGVSTVVTGAKNRAELADAVAAVTAGPLPPTIMDRIATYQRTVLARQ
jgi:aryl-alcohol dehydrogenase-like predicted oxidoreductase